MIGTGVLSLYMVAQIPGDVCKRPRGAVVAVEIELFTMRLMPRSARSMIRVGSQRERPGLGFSVG